MAADRQRPHRLDALRTAFRTARDRQPRRRQDRSAAQAAARPGRSGPFVLRLLPAEAAGFGDAEETRRSGGRFRPDRLRPRVAGVGRRRPEARRRRSRQRAVDQAARRTRRHSAPCRQICRRHAEARSRPQARRAEERHPRQSAQHLRSTGRRLLAEGQRPGRRSGARHDARRRRQARPDGQGDAPPDGRGSQGDDRCPRPDRQPHRAGVPPVLRQEDATDGRCSGQDRRRPRPQLRRPGERRSFAQGQRQDDEGQFPRDAEARRHCRQCRRLGRAPARPRPEDDGQVGQPQDRLRRYRLRPLGRQLRDRPAWNGYARRRPGEAGFRRHREGHRDAQGQVAHLSADRRHVRHLDEESGCARGPRRPDSARCRRKLVDRPPRDDQRRLDRGEPPCPHRCRRNRQSRLRRQRRHQGGEHCALCGPRRPAAGRFDRSFRQGHHQAGLGRLRPDFRRLRQGSADGLFPHRSAAEERGEDLRQAGAHQGGIRGDRLLPRQRAGELQGERCLRAREVGLRSRHHAGGSRAGHRSRLRPGHALGQRQGRPAGDEARSRRGGAFRKACRTQADGSEDRLRR